jgi:hypothetical protein
MQNDEKVCPITLDTIEEIEAQGKNVYRVKNRDGKLLQIYDAEELFKYIQSCKKVAKFPHSKRQITQQEMERIVSKLAYEYTLVQATHWYQHRHLKEIPDGLVVVNDISVGSFLCQVMHYIFRSPSFDKILIHNRDLGCKHGISDILLPRSFWELFTQQQVPWIQRIKKIFGYEVYYLKIPHTNIAYFMFIFCVRMKTVQTIGFLAAHVSFDTGIKKAEVYKYEYTSGNNPYLSIFRMNKNNLRIVENYDYDSELYPCFSVTGNLYSIDSDIQIITHNEDEFSYTFDEIIEYWCM